MITTQRLTQVMVEVAGTLGADFDLLPFLGRITAHTADLSGSAAVGMMLTDRRGDLRPVAAHDPDGRTARLLGPQSVQGPYVDCVATQRPVVVADLADAGAVAAWPAWAPLARCAGLVRVHALPMATRSETIGALALLSTHSTPFDPSEVAAVQALVDVVSIAVVKERALSRTAATVAQLQLALDTRIVVEQAKGALAQREGVSVDEAFETLRAAARSSRRPLLDVAHEVLAGGSPA